MPTNVRTLNGHWGFQYPTLSTLSRIRNRAVEWRPGFSGEVAKLIVNRCALYLFLTFTYIVFPEKLLRSCPLGLLGLLLWMMYRLDLFLLFYWTVQFYFVRLLKCVFSHHRPYQSKVCQTTVGGFFFMVRCFVFSLQYSYNIVLFCFCNYIWKCIMLAACYALSCYC